MSNKKVYSDGTKRVRLVDLKMCVKDGDSWKPISDLDKIVNDVIELYKNNHNEKFILDEIDDEFILGHITPDENISGGRIKYLPNGKMLARGGFSIFAEGLSFNLDKKKLWDVCFKNSSGLWTYLYSIDKVHIEQKEKYKLVLKFGRYYETILNKLFDDMKKKKDLKYVALYLLLKSHIRVGNYEYYVLSGHKGLTTLQKKNVFIEDGYVVLDYVGKDGIPQYKKVFFEELPLKLLKKRLDMISDEDFVFTNDQGIVFHSDLFSKILFKYTGEHFYPHIIRSYYADFECKKFISRNRRKKVTKKDVNNKFMEIAEELGHKKFDKKSGVWKVSYKVTLDSYIYPKLSEKMKNIICDDKK